MKSKAQILIEEIKNSSKLSSNVKHKVNKELTKLTVNKYFEKIPLKDTSDILKKYGLILLQEDQTEWDGFLTGNNARATFDVGYIETKDKDNRYTPIDNAALVMSWYKMPSARYEIVVYLG
jgi:hypothetical protein